MQEQQTMNNITLDPSKRHDFVLLFDVTDGNPNGDPDADNLPRTDPETQHGLVTDVCIKRKVRNYASLIASSQSEPERYHIYIQDGAVLNEQHQLAYDALGLETSKTKRTPATINAVREWMCQHFYDIRMFGAVMGTEVNAGQVRGPLQLTFARSCDPVFPQSLAITRCAATKREKIKTKDNGNGDAIEYAKELRTIGRKTLIPYGLYVMHGFYNPTLGQQTGASENDLALFWQALTRMFECDRSAARGMMSTQTLTIFSHQHPLGNAAAQTLFKRVKIAKRRPETVPRSFEDYQVTIESNDMPEGVTVNEMSY